MCSKRGWLAQNCNSDIRQEEGEALRNWHRSPLLSLEIYLLTCPLLTLRTRPRPPVHTNNKRNDQYSTRWAKFSYFSFEISVVLSCTSHISKQVFVNSSNLATITIVGHHRTCIMYTQSFHWMLHRFVRLWIHIPILYSGLAQFTRWDFPPVDQVGSKP